MIAQSKEEAESALPPCSASRLVVEEFLQGEEVSFIVLSDGKNVLPLQPSQDHKAVHDNDRVRIPAAWAHTAIAGILTQDQTTM